MLSISSTNLIPVLVTFLAVLIFAVVFYLFLKNYAKQTIKDTCEGSRDKELIELINHNKSEKVIKRKKRWKIIRSVLFYTVIAIVLPIFAFSLINKIKGNTIMIGNKTMMVVGSGSMSFKNEKNTYLFEGNDPRLDYQFVYGDIIILEKVNDVNDLNVYDVICYHDSVKEMNIIHRIVEIKSGGEKKFITRGDANEGVGANDKFESSMKDIIGQYNGKCLKGIGLFILFLQSYAGIVTIVTLAICIFIYDALNKKINAQQEKRVKELSFILEFDETNQFVSTKDVDNSITYENYIYSFDEDGNFIKREIK